jgi:hypothetical protein
MPFGPSETIRDAVKKLLDQKEGFVIFDDGKDDEYVQYSLLRELDFREASGDLDNDLECVGHAAALREK